MSIIRLLRMTIFVAVLANCGSPSANAPVSTRWPTATVAVDAQTSPTDAINTTPATPVATVVSNTIDSLASGLTPEGYHVLGDMAAPITFIDYSDYF